MDFRMIRKRTGLPKPFVTYLQRQVNERDIKKMVRVIRTDEWQIHVVIRYIPYIWMVFRQYEFYSDSWVCSIDEIVSRRRHIGTVSRRLQSLWLHDLELSTYETQVPNS